MPSTLHELLVRLLRATAQVFLSHMIPVRWARVRWRDANVVLPMPDGRDRRADLLLVDVHEPPAVGMVVEVQLRWEDRKLYTMSYYQHAARDVHQCPIVAVLVTPKETVAERFAAGTDLGDGLRWRPIVVGPRDAWAYLLLYESDTLSHELLALLTCLAGQLDDGRLARARFSSAIAVDSAPDAGYLEWAVRSLSEVGAQIFTELTMNARTTTHPRDFKNPLAVWWYGTGLEEGRDEGRIEGQVELLTLVAPLCSAAELDALRALPDLPTLRRAIQQRLGLPVTEPDAE